MYKLCIFGSRNLFPSKLEINASLERFGFAGRHYPTEIVCGGAVGADAAGQLWAESNGVSVRHFIPDWKKLGKGAGKVRNEEMARYCDAGLGFWDGDSPGTANMTAWLEALEKLHYLVLQRPQ